VAYKYSHLTNISILPSAGGDKNKMNLNKICIKR